MTWMIIKFTVWLGATISFVAGVMIAAASGSGVNTNPLPTRSEEPILIVPGQSVGKVRKGMTTNEVEAVLGKPERWQGKIMVYDKTLGMSVGLTRKGVMVIFCGDSMLKYPGVKRFKGRTKGGVGMESSRADVIKEFGKPTTGQPWGDGQEQLEYRRLGLTFILDFGKVINFCVDFRPAS
jgi:hypothetical protein